MKIAIIVTVDDILIPAPPTWIDIPPNDLPIWHEYINEKNRINYRIKRYRLIAQEENEDIDQDLLAKCRKKIVEEKIKEKEQSAIRLKKESERAAKRLEKKKASELALLKQLSKKYAE